MEPQRFSVHFILVITVFIAIAVSQIVSSAGAGPGTAAGGTDVPHEGGFANPLPGDSTGPTTGESNDYRATNGTVQDRTRSEPADLANDSTSPGKSPFSHAEKHPDYDRMDADKNKVLDKESH